MAEMAKQQHSKKIQMVKFKTQISKMALKIRLAKFKLDQAWIKKMRMKMMMIFQMAKMMCRMMMKMGVVAKPVLRQIFQTSIHIQIWKVHFNFQIYPYLYFHNIEFF